MEKWNEIQFYWNETMNHVKTLLYVTNSLLFLFTASCLEVIRTMSRFLASSKAEKYEVAKTTDYGSIASLINNEVSTPWILILKLALNERDDIVDKDKIEQYLERLFSK